MVSARCLLVLLLACVARAQEWPSAELRKELAVLDDAKATADARAAARQRFERLVAAGGAALVDDAIARMSDAGTRRRSQLVLAGAGRVPPARLVVLTKARDPAVALYPALCARRFVEPATFLAKRLRYPTDDTALKHVAKEVHARLLPEQDPAPPQVKQEYAKDWRTVIKPRLLAFWERIPRHDRYLLGPDLMLVVARELVRTHWINDFRFVAFLRRKAGRWTLAGFHRFKNNELVNDAVVGDFDGDGTLEAAVWTWWGGGYSYGHLTMFSADKMDGVRIGDPAAYRPFTDTPIVKGADGTVYFARWNYHLQADGNKHREALGVIAYAVHLYRWRANGFVHAGCALIPLHEPAPR